VILGLYLKLIRLMAQDKKVPAIEIVADYDRLAVGYDENFAARVKCHSYELINRLNIFNGAKVLELACGTGVITEKIAGVVGASGRVIAVDNSSKMLEKAREKSGNSVNFIQADMLAALKDLSAETFDFAICGWAIGYHEPLAMLAGMCRVLKPAGKIGIIENRRDTLKVVRDASWQVMARYPGDIEYLMDLPLRLPRDPGDLTRWFKRVGLASVDSWTGDTCFEFKSGVQVLDWVLKTGASAGFDRMMSAAAKEKCDKAFIDIMDKRYKHDGVIKVSHRFVAGIAVKR